MSHINPQARSFLERVHDVPSPPDLYYTLRKEVSDPYSSINRIAEVISADQGLTSRLLRLANSAFFGFPRKVDDIADAVSLIGLQQVRDLALCTMVLEMFGHIPASLMDMNAFWRHSLGVGIIARILASHQREANIERFFVAGLLHDLGKLVLLMGDAASMRQIFEEARNRRTSGYRLERDRFQFDHADLGGLLLSSWSLPDPLIESTSCHHNPLAADKFVLDASLVHVADIIAHTMELGTSGERFVPVLDEKAWTKLGIRTGIFEGLLRETDRQHADVVNIMLHGPK